MRKCRPLTSHDERLAFSSVDLRIFDIVRRNAGESVEEVSRFLDHSSLAVTTTYLRRLEGQEDKSWEKVATAIGL
jgi:hypothetical protein